MPANPWDYSQILLSNNAGQSLGQGIAGLASGLSQGILGAVQEHRQKKKEKEAEQGAIDWLKKNGQAMGLNSTDDGELKAAVKAAGGGMQAIQLISGLEQQKAARAAQQQQMQLTAAQLKAYEAGQQSLLRNTGAARIAAGGMPGQAETGAMLQGGSRFTDTLPNQNASPDAMVASYLRNSGDLAGAGNMAEGLSRLAVLNQKETQFTPQVVDLGNGLRGMTTSRSSAVPIDPNKPAPGSPIKVGAREIVVAGGTPFDNSTGLPIQTTPERAPTPPSFEMKDIDPELYEAQRQVFLNYAKGKTGSGLAPQGQPEFGPEMEGKKVRSPDGQTYVIRQGRPVLLK
jgi:hypothetical protein